MSVFTTQVTLQLDGIPLAYIQGKALSGELSSYLTYLINKDIGFLDNAVIPLANGENIGPVNNGLNGLTLNSIMEKLNERGITLDELYGEGSEVAENLATETAEPEEPPVTKLSQAALRLLDDMES